MVVDGVALTTVKFRTKNGARIGAQEVRAVVGPAFMTRQQEAAAELGEMVNGNPQLMAILGDVWVKMRNFPEAEKISRRLKAMLPPQVQQAEEEDGQQQLPPQYPLREPQWQLPRCHRRRPACRPAGQSRCRPAA